MSLIDQLRDIGAALPPSHIPGPAEALPILGALIAAAEHDVEPLAAAAKEDLAARDRGEAPAAVDNILAPPKEVSDAPVTAPVAQAPAEPVPSPAAPAPATDQQQPAVDVAQLAQQRDQLQEQVISLSQQVQTLLADRQRTEASVTNQQGQVS